MQVANAAELCGTETVRVRLFNIYGPGEYYSPYRSERCIFCYRALTGQQYQVYTDHHRTRSILMTQCVLWAKSASASRRAKYTISAARNTTICAPFLPWCWITWGGMTK